MVSSPHYVIYNDNLHRVAKQIGSKLYLIPNSYNYGWSDPRSIFGNVGGVFPVDNSLNYLVVEFGLCQPITKEVAEIMRGV